MNWFNKFILQSTHSMRKKALTTDTMPYFQELQDEGQYVPDTDRVTQNLQQRYNTKVTNSLGCGDNGCAYLLTNGNILKVTTNDQEGKVALWLKANPHPNIVSYFDVWKDGDLWYIIMEKVETKNVNSQTIRYIDRKSVV